MAIVPWSLLYITKPFQLWVELWSTSCCTLWHKMHIFICDLTTSWTTLKSLSLKNPHVFADLCHGALEFLVEFKLEKQLFMLCNNFSLKKFQVVFTKVFINNCFH
jgi:hypothetical protein